MIIDMTNGTQTIDVAVNGEIVAWIKLAPVGHGLISIELNYDVGAVHPTQQIVWRARKAHAKIGPPELGEK